MTTPHTSIPPYSEPPESKKQITLSDRAADQIAKILEGEAPDTKLRVSVAGGGCSGFQYGFELVTQQNADDLVLEKAGATVLIDSVSQQYMPGAVIDYATELIGAAFKIVNPLASASCGCGTSFSIG